MLVSHEDAGNLISAFEEFVRDRAFPCVGAKSALSRGTLKTVPCWSLTSGWDDVNIHRALIDWAFEYRRDPSLFRSIAFLFTENEDLTEQGFEAAMWERIQSLADKDAWLSLPYDARVSGDPGDPHFSLSFGGEAFFVVGLHPRASRPARRFERPALVFNLHDQFELLRAEGRYETIRDKIMERDLSLAGTHNPMLARHGDSSEAAQYSGRAVGPDWECPFRDPRVAVDADDRA